jgi:hypothetical protein
MKEFGSVSQAQLKVVGDTLKEIGAKSRVLFKAWILRCGF